MCIRDRGYAHPFFHAAKRRNCDGDEDCVMLLMDGLLNFSRSYLPDRRGGQMDAPLVLTSRIDPNEVERKRITWMSGSSIRLNFMKRPWRIRIQKTLSRLWIW